MYEVHLIPRVQTVWDWPEKFSVFIENWNWLFWPVINYWGLTDYLRGNWVHFVNGTLSDISDLNTWSKNTPTGSLTSNFIAVWLWLQTNQNNLKFDHRSHMYMFCSARFWNVNKIIWSWQRSALKVFLFCCILYI